MSAFLKIFLGRALEAVLTLLLLVTLCFALLRAAPGGPFDNERAAPPEAIASLNARYHLDEPLWRQYLRYLGDVAQGDLGPSFQYSDYTVNELIALGLPVSAATGGLALLLALALGAPLGIAAALHQGRWLDRALSLGAGLALSIPKFVAAPLLILLFAVQLRWFPAGGWDGGDARFYVLPVLALALPHLAYAARLLRASLIEVLSADYIRAARARGLSESRILFAHALRPAVLPLVAWLSPALIAVVTGSAIVEQIFGLPGMGRYFVQGALNRDYTLVLGVVLTVGALTIVVNLLIDVLRAGLDPRLRA